MSDETPVTGRDRLIRQIELLELENRSLLAHLAESGTSDQFVRPDEVVVTAAELATLRQAAEDLDALIDLIATDPAATLMKRRRRFQQVARRRLP